jgi:hypothetical protein
VVENEQYDVFLSHNSADKPAVEILARRLVGAGLTPWLDTWNLIPGDPWQEAIEEALDACQQDPAIYAASETPLHLLNQIEAEETEIHRIEGQLRALEDKD